MVSTCCAYGCTQRHKKGDNIGMHRFPKDEKLRKLWTVAVRRADWKPTPSSRICGKHFMSGKPSKDRRHPDYVPSLFVFNQYKITTKKWKSAQENISQKAKIINAVPCDVTNQRILKSQPDANITRLVPIKMNEKDRKLQPIKPSPPFCHFFTSSKDVKEETVNVERRKATEVSNDKKKSLIYKDKKPALPQTALVLNFTPPKKDSNISIENLKEVKSEPASFSSPNRMTEKPMNSVYNFDQVSISTNNISQVDADSCVHIDSVSNDNVSTTSEGWDDCTLSAESSMSGTNNDVLFNIESDMVASYDSVPLNVMSFASVGENANDETEYTFENLPKDILDDTVIPTVKPLKETTDYDYSYFASSPIDSKDILEIKLETMLAINISLQQKVKFYQNKCKHYEKEINTLANTIKDLKLINHL